MSAWCRTGTVLVLTGALAWGATPPAGATLVNGPGYHEAFDDQVCGIAAHVTVDANNPVVLTGKTLANGDQASVDTGHLLVRFTNPADSHWVIDEFSGPAKVIAATVNTDGSTSKRVVFSGTKREFRAWDGAVVADRGRLVVDYVILNDRIVSRTLVSQVGDFPIASGAVGFCEFVGARLA